MTVQIESQVFDGKNILFSFSEEIGKNIFNDSEKVSITYNKDNDSIEIKPDENGFDLTAKRYLLDKKYFVNIPCEIIGLEPTIVNKFIEKFYKKLIISYHSENDTLIIDRKQFDSFVNDLSSSIAISNEGNISFGYNGKNKVQYHRDNETIDVKDTNNLINYIKKFMETNKLDKFHISGSELSVEINYKETQ